jgi:hypothetical protein
MASRSILAAAVLFGIAFGIAGAAAAAEPDTRVFEMRTYYAPPGRLDDLHARFRNHALKLIDKHGITSVGYWTPVENPDNKLIFVLAFPSAEAREKAWKAFLADPDWKEARKITEADGPIVAKIESVVLGATDYSPVVAPAVEDDRVFELRTYVASPGNLGNLNARFRNHTLKLFEKHGITNVVYWCPLEGQPGAGEQLIYLIAHKSVDAAKASFDAFRQDPAWIAARAASEEKAGGSLTAPGGVRSEFLRATDYSPLR